MCETSKNNSGKSQVEKCPKCSGEMKSGRVVSYGDVRILKQGDLLTGDKVYAFYCRDCGFIEFYKEPSTRSHGDGQKSSKCPQRRSHNNQRRNSLFLKPQRRG